MIKQENDCAPCIWMTGLSGAGKTTLAHALNEALKQINRRSVILDGDIVRSGLCRDLGFSLSDRQENLRRICEVAKILAEAGIIPIVACITPRECDRQAARSYFPDGRFILVFIDTPLEVCEARDAKGLYAKARSGKIVDFTGVSSPFERPEKVEVCLRGTNTSHKTIKQIVKRVL